ncbi:D-amino-acid transaminase [Aerophototrophica crusticola]|uniref:Probable branched-chain-amino-acid aminotransferase n=1 Tax=Aerophototrophica crusticola TaxID=1709002 RepID=A0A858R662_9PROT|nr:D-amino-acid transaminase [Rhodospirillaceae bacterium B3]
MPRIAYVNGRYVPHGEASVHVEDRGFQFADGVYEVVTVVGGKLADEEGHLARLGRSLGELQIPWPVKPAVLKVIMREVVRRNGAQNALLYIQVNRGVAPRDFRFPANPRPSLVLTCRRTKFQTARQLAEGVPCVTVPDIRWLRRDIKSVALLAQVLAKQKAVEAGAFEAWQVDPDGTVTEGSSSNAWIVTADGVLVTRPASNLILNGITRQSILRLAGELGIPFEERPFTVEEAYAAREAFISSASTFALPVTRLDGRSIGDGTPGPLCRKLRQAYMEYVGSPDPVGAA